MDCSWPVTGRQGNYWLCYPRWRMYRLWWDDDVSMMFLSHVQWSRSALAALILQRRVRPGAFRVIYAIKAH